MRPCLLTRSGEMAKSGMPGVENPLKGSMAGSYVPVLSGVDLQERKKN